MAKTVGEKQRFRDYFREHWSDRAAESLCSGRQSINYLVGGRSTDAAEHSGIISHDKGGQPQ